MTNTNDSPNEYPMAYEWGFDGRFTLSTDRVIGYALTINDAAELSRRWNAARSSEQEAAIKGLVKAAIRTLRFLEAQGSGKLATTPAAVDLREAIIAVAGHYQSAAEEREAEIAALRAEIAADSGLTKE